VDVEAARTLLSPASDHLQVVADLVLPRPKPERPRRFDLQAHRGGLGLVTERARGRAWCARRGCSTG
jgi:hypothetical protein